jgi:hypothetical protein
MYTEQVGKLFIGKFKMKIKYVPNDKPEGTTLGELPTFWDFNQVKKVYKLFTEEVITDILKIKRQYNKQTLPDWYILGRYNPLTDEFVMDKVKYTHMAFITGLPKGHVIYAGKSSEAIRPMEIYKDKFRQYILHLIKI